MTIAFRSTDFSLSACRRADLAEVYQLSRHSHLEDFWEPEHFARLLKRPDQGCVLARYKPSDYLMGFVCFQRRPRDMRILRFCQRPSAYGDDLSRYLLSCLTPPGACLPLSVVVRESDLVSQLFWKQMGFRWERTQPDWFDCPPEAAYLFVQRLGKERA